MQASQQAPVAERRDDLMRAAAAFSASAEQAASSGEIEQSARDILRSLDCERRAGSVGPQVMQLIKPRN
ncbi:MULTISPECIES: hypothetical protein [Synechococcaceae]|jgi:hypothetical protein|uniref:hypothetical protein n=1 Tax=Synechococcaceae TaxID=1890426 RepID=UPI0002001C2B|nr:MULTISPECIES: hypothetical protein [Synechococcaceae]